MIKSMDILTRNFDVLRLRQENLSANAANVTTPGFKYQQLVQTTLAANTAINHTGGEKKNQRLELGDFQFGNQIDEAVTNMQDGALRLTNNPTDFAVIGDVFFTIDGPNGVMYTKNGQFSVNENGQLVTTEGYIVRTTGNAFFDHTLTVDQNGYINGGNSQFVLSSFGDAMSGLSPTDNGYFIGGGAVQNNGSGMVYQGYLESANVDIVDIMVEMMQITREYEANQKVLHASNETLQQATNQIGKV